MYCDIESCFSFNNLDYRNLYEIETSYLTALILQYRDFDTVLQHAGNMRYNVKLIAGTCDISESEACRQLLEKEIMCVLDHFEYFQPEEVQEQYSDIINAYYDCLCSQKSQKKT